MQTWVKTFHLVLILGLFEFSASCKKLNPDKNELPPLSHEGKETFGCLIDGKVFTPKARGLFTSTGNCYYQKKYLNSNHYVFSLTGNRFEDDCATYGIGLRLDSVILEQGRTYRLTSQQIGNGSGSYESATNCQSEYLIYNTTDSINGEITISYFNADGIVSGTFWFDAIGEDGRIIHVTEGRFDRRYTD